MSYPHLPDKAANRKRQIAHFTLPINRADLTEVTERVRDDLEVWEEWFWTKFGADNNTAGGLALRWCAGSLRILGNVVDGLEDLQMRLMELGEPESSRLRINDVRTNLQAAYMLARASERRYEDAHPLERPLLRKHAYDIVQHFDGQIYKWMGRFTQAVPANPEDDDLSTILGPLELPPTAVLDYAQLADLGPELVLETEAEISARERHYDIALTLATGRIPQALWSDMLDEDTAASTAERPSTTLVKLEHQPSVELGSPTLFYNADTRKKSTEFSLSNPYNAQHNDQDFFTTEEDLPSRSLGSSLSATLSPPLRSTRPRSTSLMDARGYGDRLPSNNPDGLSYYPSAGTHELPVYDNPRPRQVRFAQSPSVILSDTRDQPLPTTREKPAERKIKPLTDEEAAVLPGLFDGLPDNEDYFNYKCLAGQTNRPYSKPWEDRMGATSGSFAASSFLNHMETDEFGKATPSITSLLTTIARSDNLESIKTFARHCLTKMHGERVDSTFVEEFDYSRDTFVVTKACEQGRSGKFTAATLIAVCGLIDPENGAQTAARTIAFHQLWSVDPNMTTVGGCIRYGIGDEIKGQELVDRLAPSTSANQNTFCAFLRAFHGTLFLPEDDYTIMWQKMVRFVNNGPPRKHYTAGKLKATAESHLDREYYDNNVVPCMRKYWNPHVDIEALWETTRKIRPSIHNRSTSSTTRGRRTPSTSSPATPSSGASSSTRLLRSQGSVNSRNRTVRRTVSSGLFPSMNSQSSSDDGNDVDMDADSYVEMSADNSLSRRFDGSPNSFVERLLARPNDDTAVMSTAASSSGLTASRRGRPSKHIFRPDFSHTDNLPGDFSADGYVVDTANEVATSASDLGVGANLTADVAAAHLRRKAREIADRKDVTVEGLS